jgi:broad specificity polyphosphatase/5'/3'-nucleotidase SurE
VAEVTREVDDGHAAPSELALEGVEEGTDRWAVERGLVSMTPLRLDLTDLTDLATLERARAERPV